MVIVQNASYIGVYVTLVVLENRWHMDRVRTSIEVKQDYIAVMGEQLGAVYYSLWNELVWVNAKWNEYVELWGTKPERLAIINKSANHFFRVVENVLWESCILNIARITDPVESSRGKENLTIRQLPKLVKAELVSELNDLIKVADEKSVFCRDWRNRHIAHKDFRLAMNSDATPLTVASREKIKYALSALNDVLNFLSKSYRDCDMRFDMFITSSGARSLLYVLDDGLTYQKEKRENLKSGKRSYTDYPERDL